MFCLGHSLPVYILARLLQGISSGLVWIVGLALVADTVGEGKIGMAMAWISIALNMGLLLGPLLGGIVYNRVGWYGTFGLGFGVLVFDILLRTIMIEKHIAEQYMREERPMKMKMEDAPGRRQNRVPQVISLLRYPRMIAGICVVFAQGTIIAAFDSSLPLQLNRLFGWTSFQAGKYRRCF